MVLVFATVRLILFPGPHDKFRKTNAIGEASRMGMRYRWQHSSCVSEKSMSDFRFPAREGFMRPSARTAIIVVSVLFAYALSPVHLLGQFSQRPGPPQVRSHGNPAPRVNSITNAKQKPLPALQKSLAPQQPPVIGFGGSNPIFPTELSYASGGIGAQSVAAGDFNGDGIPDLAVANYCADSSCTSSSVNILLGNGDGTFQQAVSYNSGGYEPLSVAVGDVSQDGKLDLVVSHYCISFESCGQGVVGVLDRKSTRLNSS